MDISLNCKSINISPNNGRTITVEVIDTDINEVLNEVSIEDMIEHCSKESLLEKIGKDEAMAFWKLVDEG